MKDGLGLCDVTPNELHMFLCHAVMTVWSPSSVFIIPTQGHLQLDVNVDYHPQLPITRGHLDGLGHLTKTLFGNVDYAMHPVLGRMWIWTTEKASKTSFKGSNLGIASAPPGYDNDGEPSHFVIGSDKHTRTDAMGRVWIGFTDTHTLLEALWQEVPHTSVRSPEQEASDPTPNFNAVSTYAGRGLIYEAHGRSIYTDLSTQWVDFSAYDLFAGRGTGMAVMRRLKGEVNFKNWKSPRGVWPFSPKPRPSTWTDTRSKREDTGELIVFNKVGQRADKLVELLGFVVGLFTPKNSGKDLVKISMNQMTITHGKTQLFTPARGLVVGITAGCEFLRYPTMLWDVLLTCAGAFGSVARNTLEIPKDARDKVVATILGSSGHMECNHHKHGAFAAVEWPVGAPVPPTTHDVVNGPWGFGKSVQPTKKAVKDFIRGVSDIAFPTNKEDVLIVDAGYHHNIVLLGSERRQQITWKICQRRMAGIGYLTRAFFGGQVDIDPGYGYVHFSTGGHRLEDTGAVHKWRCECLEKGERGACHPYLEIAHPAKAIKLFKFLVETKWGIGKNPGKWNASGWTILCTNNDSSYPETLWMFLSKRYMQEKNIGRCQVQALWAMSFALFNPEDYKPVGDLDYAWDYQRTGYMDCSWEVKQISMAHDFDIGACCGYAIRRDPSHVYLPVAREIQWF